MGASHALLRAGEDPPPPYQIAVLPGYERILGEKFALSAADRVGRFRAMAKASDIDSLIAALSPPSLTLGANCTMLQICIVRSRLSSSKCLPNISVPVARLASTITSSLIPSLNKAIEFYIKFADGQQDPFSTVSAMENIIAERWQELNEGSNFGKAAETVFINFRSDSQAALNTAGSSFHIIQQLFSQNMFIRSSLAMSMS